MGVPFWRFWLEKKMVFFWSYHAKKLDRQAINPDNNTMVSGQPPHHQKAGHFRSGQV